MKVLNEEGHDEGRGVKRRECGTQVVLITTDMVKMTGFVSR